MPSIPELRADLERDGFALLRSHFDPGALGAELDRALREGALASATRRVGGGELGVRFVPMLGARCPVSLDLVRELAGLATALLGAPVLPGRAKGVRYGGETRWHADTELPIRSLGLLAYLDPLGPESGALRVVPGSHRAGWRAPEPGDADWRGALPTHPVVSAPGDLIILDEHLTHGSFGGRERRQWRIDFIADEPGEALERWYAGQYPYGWDPGYDPDLYPSYGPELRALNPRWAARLEALGVLAMAEAHEQAARRGRSAVVG